MKLNLICDKLHKQKIGPGTVVAICGVNSEQTILTLLAAWSLGATTWLYSPREPAYSLEEMRKSIDAQPVVCTLELGSQHQLTFAQNKLEFHPRAKTILNTSGSSGKPKFVEHAVEQHLQSARGVNAFMEFDARGKWLMSLPIFHVGGLAVLFRAIVAGGEVVIASRSESLEEAILGNDLSHVSFVPAQLKQLSSNPLAVEKLAQCQRVVLGGAPIGRYFEDIAQRHSMNLVSSYGSTEMASMWTATSLRHTMYSQASGKPLPMREIKIGSDGEIKVCGAMLFQKYCNEDASELFDDNGFFRTGDLGRLDDQGNLHILGRRDNMFISGGENIHPQEIERALLGHASIDEAVVVSVPSDKWGERPVAFVQWNAKTRMNEGELKEYLLGVLSRFKIPDRIFELQAVDQSDLKPSRIAIRQKALLLMPTETPKRLISL